MHIDFGRVIGVFVRAVPPDDIPSDVLDNFRELMKGLGQSGEDTITELFGPNFLTAGHMLVTVLGKEWDDKHPEEADLIDRRLTMFLDYVPDTENLDHALEEAQLAESIIESEEPGLTDRSSELQITRELFIAQKMKEFLRTHELPIPKEIDQFIGEWTPRSPGKETRN